MQLPDSHTGSVFTVIGEEVNWGVVGAVLGLLVLVVAVASFLLHKRKG
jgi:cell division protein FtsW (lipid II flippase)